MELERELPYSSEVKSVTASVRGVSVEIGQPRWSGTAQVRSPGLYIEDTQEGDLAELAIQRATCPVESGFVWVEK